MMQRVFGKENKTKVILNFYGSGPSPPSRSHTSECGSPTLEQAILMGCRDMVEFDYGYEGSCSLASTSPDYNLEELEPPPTPSPPDRSYCRSPLFLLGAEALQHPQFSQSGQAPCRPDLPLSEDPVSRPSCSTPENYYMLGVSPHPMFTLSDITLSPSAVSAANLLNDRPKLSAMSIVHYHLL